MSNKKQIYEVSASKEPTPLGGHWWRWKCDEHSGVVRVSEDIDLDKHRIENEVIRKLTDCGTHSIPEVSKAKFKMNLK